MLDFVQNIQTEHQKIVKNHMNFEKKKKNIRIAQNALNFFGELCYGQVLNFVVLYYQSKQH